MCIGKNVAVNENWKVIWKQHLQISRKRLISLRNMKNDFDVANYIALISLEEKINIIQETSVTMEQYEINI